MNTPVITAPSKVLIENKGYYKTETECPSCDKANINFVKNSNCVRKCDYCPTRYSVVFDEQGLNSVEE